jgi:hypothetical protein
MGAVMTAKSQALASIRQLAAHPDISRDEVLAAFDGARGAEVAAAQEQARPRPRLGLVAVLAYLGALITLVGLGIYLAENWGTLGYWMRLVVTLGVAVVCFWAATLLVHARPAAAATLTPRGTENPLTVASRALHLVAAPAFASGFASLVDPLVETSPRWAVSAVTLALMALYTVVFLVQRLPIAVFVVMAASTGLVLNLATLPFDSSVMFWSSVTFLLGVVYLVAAHLTGMPRWASRWSRLNQISPSLALLGALMVLGAGVALMVTKDHWLSSHSNLVWKLLFPLVILAVAWLAAYWQLFRLVVVAGLATWVYLVVLAWFDLRGGWGWGLLVSAIGLTLIAAPTLLAHLRPRRPA